MISISSIRPAWYDKNFMVAGMGRIFGKLCAKHPEMNGARLESSGKCVKCHADRVNAFKKTESQRDRIREYQRSREVKGGVAYHAKLERNKRWYNSNVAWRRIYNASRKKLGGSWPAFLGEIKSIYENRPDGCDVDHIVPLKGLDPISKIHVVCGLNVPWNMRYVPKEDNAKKWAWFKDDDA